MMNPLSIVFTYEHVIQMKCLYKNIIIINFSFDVPLHLKK